MSGYIIEGVIVYPIHKKHVALKSAGPQTYLLVEAVQHSPAIWRTASCQLIGKRRLRTLTENATRLFGLGYISHNPLFFIKLRINPLISYDLYPPPQFIQSFYSKLYMDVKIMTTNLFLTR